MSSGVTQSWGSENRLSALPLATSYVVVLQLQKLKRSLSFKTKSLRSKSADNFFQRTNHDMKLQVDLLSEISPRTGHLPISESQSSTPTKILNQQESNKAHVFQEHIFKKPTFCDICNHMIVGKAYVCAHVFPARNTE